MQEFFEKNLFTILRGMDKIGEEAPLRFQPKQWYLNHYVIFYIYKPSSQVLIKERLFHKE